MKNKKKYIALSLIFVTAIFALCIYFKPLQLSKMLDIDTEIRYIGVEFSVQDGDLHTEDSGFITLTADENQKLADIFDKYTYTRNISTIFSDGSMSNLGNELISIYTYQGDDLINSISISSNNAISINDKVYDIENSAQLLGEIKAIHEK